MYYVYVYRDPRPEKFDMPIYVGMGKDNRAWDHLKKSTNRHLNHLIKKLQREGFNPQPEIVAKGLTKEQAFEQEIKLIALYGRRDLGTGTLLNLTAGGEGSVELSPELLAIRNAKIKDAHSTPEAREKLSVRSNQIWNSPLGDSMRKRIREFATSDEGKRRMREGWQRKGGHSEESKKTIGEATKRIMQDPEYKARWMELQRKGCETPEAKSRKSKAVTAGWQNEETRRKRSEGIKAARSTEESRAKTRAQQAAQWTDEAKQKASEFAKERLKDPLTKARSRVANAYNWCKRKGLPYCEVTF